MGSKWTEDMTVQFVELYRDEECLWNTHLLIYRNKLARDAAITRIVQAMDIDDFGPMDVKNKIKILRSTYVQELGKIKKSQRSEARPDEIYKPKMKWFLVMNKFLKKIEKKRDSCINLDSNSRDVDEPDPHMQHFLTLQEDIPEKTEEELPPETTKENIHDVGSTPKRQKVAKANVKEVATCIKELSCLVTSIGNMQSMEPQEDEFDIFGKSVAAQLKQLPLSVAITAQDHIQQLLTRLRLSHIEDTSMSFSCT